jgi:predicted nucleic acid-binding protein
VTVTTLSDSKWVVVDSSGWVEYMGAGDKADQFASYLESPENLLLPSIVVYEVYKKLFRERGKELAEIFLSQAFGFHDRLIDLDLELSLLAARTSLETRLPMADAIIYATALHHSAKLVTSDSQFANLPGVTVL